MGGGGGGLSEGGGWGGWIIRGWTGRAGVDSVHHTHTDAHHTHTDACVCVLWCRVGGGGGGFLRGVLRFSHSKGGVDLKGGVELFFDCNFPIFPVSEARKVLSELLLYCCDVTQT